MAAPMCRGLSMEVLEQTERNEVFWCFLLAMLASFLLYRASFGFQWTYDDIAVVIQNPDIRSFTAFFHNYVPGRPVRELSYMLDYALFGLHPAGYHFQNIIWHALNGTLLFALIRRLGGRFWAACLAAAIFLVHPIQVEVVASIGTRKDSLALAFGLMSLLAFMRFSRQESKRWRWLLLTALTYGLAVESKQNMALLPLVFMAFELAYLPAEGRWLTRRKWPLWAGAAALAAALGYWFFHYFLSDAFVSRIQWITGKYGILTPLDRWHYYLMVLKAPALLLAKVFWPVGLSLEYYVSVPTGLGDPWVLAGVGILVLAAIGLIFTRKRSPAAFVLLSMAVAFWLPVSNLLGYLDYLVADRYLYAIMAGLTGLLAVGLGKALARPSVGTVLLLLFAVVLSPLTLRQETVWQSPQTLFSQVLKVNPKSQVALRGLADIASGQGDYDKAIGLLGRCLKINSMNSKAFDALGTVYNRKKENGKAVACFRRAIAIDPDETGAYFNLGITLETMGRGKEAVAAIRQGIARSPFDPKGYRLLGRALAANHEYEQAEAVLRQGVAQASGGTGSFYFELGKVYFLEHRPQDALGAFQSSLAAAPGYFPALVGEAQAFKLLHDQRGLARIRAGIGQLPPLQAAMLKGILSGNGAVPSPPVSKPW